MVDHRNNSRDPDQARNQDPFATVHNQGIQSAPTPQHGGKESADHEEQRQTEPVDHRENNGERLVLLRIVNCPSALGTGHEGNRRMQHNAQQHRPRPERVEVVSSWKRSQFRGFVFLGFIRTDDILFRDTTTQPEQLRHQENEQQDGDNSADTHSAKVKDTDHGDDTVAPGQVENSISVGTSL